MQVVYQLAQVTWPLVNFDCVVRESTQSAGCMTSLQLFMHAVVGKRGLVTSDQLLHTCRHWQMSIQAVLTEMSSWTISWPQTTWAATPALNCLTGPTAVPVTKVLAVVLKAPIAEPA